MALGSIEERNERAKAVRQRLFGPPGPTPPAGGSALNPDFMEMVNEWVFGGVWSRPGLELEQRSMIVMSVLTALGRSAELRAHMMAARRLGITEEQIHELLMQVAMYAGVPAAVNGFNTSREAFQQFNQQAGG